MLLESLDPVSLDGLDLYHSLVVVSWRAGCLSRQIWKRHRCHDAAKAMVVVDCLPCSPPLAKEPPANRASVSNGPKSSISTPLSHTPAGEEAPLPIVWFLLCSSFFYFLVSSSFVINESVQSKAAAQYFDRSSKFMLHCRIAGGVDRRNW